jgi:hypothetical protein
MAAHDDTQAVLALGRGFVATQYLLGRRNSDLALPEGLPATARVTCETLVQQLRSPDKATRARALAPEIALLVRALQQREVR